MKRLLTIQDISCVGQCSTTVALPLISACGVECAILPPALLSNHTAAGFKGWSFCDLTAELPKVEAKWVEQDIKFDAFYTGYVCESHIDPILSIFKSCAKPGSLRIVDPAMADNGVLYKGFAADFPTKMARLCDGADYLLPNLTEAAFLTGEDPVFFGAVADAVADAGDGAGADAVADAGAVDGAGADADAGDGAGADAGDGAGDGAGASRPRREDIERLISKLHGLGVKTVVLTGVSFAENELGSAVSDGKSVSYDFNPRLPCMFHGTGDVFASVFAGAILRGKSALEAAALAADIVCAAIKATDSGHWYGVSFEKVIPDLALALRHGD